MRQFYIPISIRFLDFSIKKFLCSISSTLFYCKQNITQLYYAVQQNLCYYQSYILLSLRFSASSNYFWWDTASLPPAVVLSSLPALDFQCSAIVVAAKINMMMAFCWLLFGISLFKRWQKLYNLLIICLMPSQRIFYCFLSQ